MPWTRRERAQRLSHRGRSGPSKGIQVRLGKLSTLRVLAAVTLLSSIGNGLSLEFLMVYLHDGRGIPLTAAGVALAANGLANLASAGIAGTLLDRLGAPRSLAIGLLLGSVAIAALAWARDFSTAAAAMALLGVSNGFRRPARQMAVYAATESEGRTRAFGSMFVVMNLGFGLGSLAAGAVVSLHDPHSYQVVFLADAALTALAALVLEVGYGLRRAGARSTTAAKPRGKVSEVATWSQVRRDRPFMVTVALSFGFSFFGYAQLDSAWAAYVTQYAHASAGLVGYAFAANTAAIVVSQMAMNRLSDRLPRSRALALSGAWYCATWLITLLATATAVSAGWRAVLLVGALVVFGLGETVYSPVAPTLVNDLAPEQLRGRYNATASAAASGAGVVAPPISGTLIATGTPLGWSIPMLAISAAVSLAALGMRSVLPKHAERPPAERTRT